MTEELVDEAEQSEEHGIYKTENAIGNVISYNIADEYEVPVTTDSELV